MKKFALIAGALASVLSTSAMAAPAYNGHDNRSAPQRVEQRGDDRGRDDVRQTRTQQNANHKWNKGDRFDSRQARNYRVIAQPKAYGIKQAPKGHRWVQSGNDAILIGITSGVVAAVLANVIR